MTKILVIEDDPMIRDVLTQRLMLGGYQVITAADGAQGVHCARVQRPDLIVMDMGLPILNGWQTTHRIRSMPVTRAIPIIALTAYVMTQDRAKCLDVGCNEFEPKPINFDRLLEKIQVLLSTAVQHSV